MKTTNLTKEEAIKKFQDAGEVLDDTILNPNEFKFLGFANKLYPSLENEEVLWRALVFESVEGFRFAFWDLGNTWVKFLCGGSEEELKEFAAKQN
ncbi:hypothetical protein O0Q50_20725 [Priestia aryabhattai]|uniref:Uncharacterized protein n=1 Tax=Priestia aryabhattai TaxID=412384 RepID=A0AAX6NDL9_PRIAR|nr:hypothetical protein [Priestia aryabhattai]MDU9693605.1 hypothetical protein [Priestia aryabhattai]